MLCLSANAAKRRIEQTLKEVLEITYFKDPREFYTNYKHASGNTCVRRLVILYLFFWKTTCPTLLV